MKADVPLNQKVSNLIQYIKELSQLRQKPVSSYRNYEDILWIDEIPREGECKDAFRDDIEEWLYIKKPIIPRRPSLPNNIEEWVVILKNKLVIKDSIYIKANSVEDDEEEVKEIFLKELPDTLDEINRFVESKWDPFIEEYDRASNVQKIYEKLFKIHQSLKNNVETLEFVVGVGLLQWKQGSKYVVERPLLTSEVELQFNNEKGEMIIVPSSKGALFTYEEDMLLMEDRLSADDHKEVQSLLEEHYNNGDIQENFDAVLTKIVNTLDPRGTYSNLVALPSRREEGAIVTLTPVFMVRKKSQKSFLHACDIAITQLEDMEESLVPGNLTNMFVDVAPDDNSENGGSIKQQENDFYFPLPYNNEQNRIISQLNYKSSVLVQGPPGTGKTHTIANLTSHLLATGKRILITSQTAKALNVLKSKLPENLQDLSVSLLGGDAASMKDLEKVVSTISYNKEALDLDKLSSKVKEKEAHLDKLKQSLNRTKTEIMQIREAETYIHSFPSFNDTASEIALQLQKDESLYDWYSTPSSSDKSYLQEEKNLVSRYISLKNEHIDIPMEYEQYAYPSLEEVIDIEEIIVHIKEEKNLKKKLDLLLASEDHSLQNMIETVPAERLAKLEQILKEYAVLHKSILYNTYPKLRDVVNDIFENRGHVWKKVHLELAEHLRVINETKDVFSSSIINAEGVSTNSLKAMTEDLIRHFADGGKMGNALFRPKIVKQYKDILKKISINDAPIKSKEQIETLYAYAKWKDAFEEVEKLMLPHLLNKRPIVENMVILEYENCHSELSNVLKIAEWRESTLSQFEFLYADNFNEKSVHGLLVNIELYNVRTKLNSEMYEIHTKIQMIKNELSDDAHPVYSELISAMNKRSMEELLPLKDQYEYLKAVTNRDGEIRRIASKILLNSPDLFKLIETTVTSDIWEQRLSIWAHAQNWKTTKDWLSDFNQKDEKAVADKYEEIESEIRRVITEIGSDKAWISMLSKMTPNQARHLVAWAQTVRKIGKGTGKNAPRYIREAQFHMEKCKDAIPAWIMPLNRVFENFDIRPGLFDIVIVDEASQSWHDALLLKYLAKKMIIVGDKEQISPHNVGIRVEDVASLQNKYLKPIDFEFISMLDTSNSFFDVSEVMFKPITLQEHFRCMPEIIGFSNVISYSNKPLIPLRQYPANRLEPIVSRYLPHGVRKGTSSSATNEVEADEIVKEIRNCLEDEKYSGKSIGVISLLGNYQARLIQNKLLAELGVEVMEERQIICGDAYDFQGDERDIIFLSMVAAKEGDTRLTALAKHSDRQRFNVAASRAKDQLWVMHSVSVNDIGNPGCMRYQLLNYIMNPLREEAAVNREKCESGFEKSVFDTLVRRGYRVIPQFEVAGSRLDFVVQGAQSRLAVECDGDYWHTSVEDRERDFQRELLLQRAGWTFWRVLGSKYYANPEKALESLWRTLDEMNIRPYVEWATVEETGNSMEFVSPVTEDTPNPVANNNSTGFREDLDGLGDSKNELDEQKDTEKPYEQIEPVTVGNYDLLNRQLPTMMKVKKTKPVSNASVAKQEYEQTSLLLIDEEDEKETPRNVQQDILGLHEVQIYKEKLERGGFSAFVVPAKADRIYVLGSIELETELSRIAPRGNSFTFLKEGNSDTEDEPAWYIDIDLDIELSSKDNSKENKALEKEMSLPKTIGKRNQDQSHLTTLLLEMKTLGLEVIDYCQKSATIYVIGGNELERPLYTYKKHGLKFQRLETGNKTTGYRSAWYAKVKQ